MKVYATETPLNSACIAPLRPYVILGGGQDAMSVTTTSSRAGKFESRFWHKLFEEEVGRVKGHLCVVALRLGILPDDADAVVAQSIRLLCTHRDVPTLRVQRTGLFVYIG